MQGEVIDRSHPEYDRARQVWNGLIDRYPAVIARCAGTADVVAAVRAAAHHRPEVSIRGGGHQVVGSAVCDDGLVIDLSRMKGVYVDPANRIARVQPGVTWGELNRETQVFGLVTPGGEVSTTGVAGFTLGGGMSHLQRAYGLSCDNLRAVEIVTADGVVRRANRDEHPDLLWAARGGGRGIGVVTWLEYDLHPLGPEVAVAQVLYPYEDAERILRDWPEVALAAPRTVTPELALWCVPPSPSIPPEWHLAKVVMAAGMYAGPVSEAERALAPLRRLGRSALDLSGTVPYVDAEAAVDLLFPAGGRYYMKSHFMDELNGGAITTALGWDSRRPTPETLTVIRTFGGAVAEVEPDESAYPHRSSPFNLSVDASWYDPSRDEAAIRWARGMWDALTPFATGGVYVNFAGLGDESVPARSLLGANQRRLDEVRRRYDPGGLFAAAARRP